MSDHQVEIAQVACPECGHLHTPRGCSGPPTPSDRWAGVTVASCDCEPGECERCEGTGDLYGRSTGPIALCPDCNGTGHVTPPAGGGDRG